MSDAKDPTRSELAALSAAKRALLQIAQRHEVLGPEYNVAHKAAAAIDTAVSYVIPGAPYVHWMQSVPGEV